MLDRVQQRAWRSVRTAARTSSSASKQPLTRVSGVSSLASLSPASTCSSHQDAYRPTRPSSLLSSNLQQRCLHFGPDYANQPGPSRSQARSKATPLDEITRLRELINRANATNSKLSKERILAEFDDLIPLLAFLYDPYTRLHVTSSTVQNYLRQRRKDFDWQNNQAPLVSLPSNRSRDKTRAAALRAKQEEDVREQTPETLLELFELLASRGVTGHEALAVIRNFLEQHGIIEQHEYALSGSDDPNLSTTELFRRGLLRPTALEIFYRCLDRNLKAGFGERILHQAFAAGSPPHSKSTSKVDKSQQGRSSDPTISLRESFQVALGRTITREELPSLFANTDAPQWYASRKLDGVRCLFVVRLHLKLQKDVAGAKWEVGSIVALSRNGRPFTSLAVLEKQLAQKLTRFRGLQDLIRSATDPSTDDNGVEEQLATATLILDGEVCILRPPEQASASAAKQIDATLSDANQGATEQTMVEDFAAVVGLIKRKNYTIREPAFFPFDLLTLDEFTNWRSQATDAQPRRTFSQRLALLESLVSFFESDARQQRKQPLIRKLSQHVVATTDQVEHMLATASQRGWEGLVLRQDTPYEGKRTSAIRKFKEWKDAEYTVHAITLATMRLPIQGRFEERQAMASIQIEHRGTRVSVGSGFTPEQRVEFASDPDRIVGKVVTVEYFDESRTIASAAGMAGQGEAQVGGEGKEVFSLRFPRIKQIWGEGRDV
ncbi:conserved hypothetical protein [Sporisorium reilianum SRZ2]|uniref:ATP-dependent DNA ligase family profile domain-containing protein n=1 Tax=Sporisorium reilianum (strain SRZ2) TaxID=999809 RepID=E6ZTP1_SPORE|nr:conserved hypothetical protein [Sporisorium reilianum SRZ2]